MLLAPGEGGLGSQSLVQDPGVPWPCDLGRSRPRPVQSLHLCGDSWPLRPGASPARGRP